MRCAIVKKILILMQISLILMLSSCGDGTDAIDRTDAEDVEIDIAALADILSAEIEYDDTLAKVESYVLDMLYDCGDFISASCGYCASGGTSEVVAVFECKSIEYADKVVERLELYRQSMKEDFARYTPAEVSKLENAVIEAKGKYVIFSVSPDSDKAMEIINNYISQLQK